MLLALKHKRVTYHLQNTLIFLLKDEFRDKLVTISNLKINIQETNVCSKRKDDVIGGLLGIDELYHRFQKLKDQSQSSTDTPTTSVNVKSNHFQENRADWS